MKKDGQLKFLSEEPEGGDGLPYGWFNKNDIFMYRKLYGNLRKGAITAEVGVWQGRSICSVADIILKNDLEVYAVDTFKGSFSAIDSVHNFDGRLQVMFKKNKNEFGLKNHVITIKEDSIKAAKKINKMFDLVFIDADHAPKSIMEDIFSWLPFVKKGGVLSGHDYQWVKKFVCREFKKRGFKIFDNKENIFWVNKD